MNEWAVADMMYRAVYGRGWRVPDVDLLPKQAQFVYSPLKRNAFVAGIGSGKSYAGGIKAIRASQGIIGGGASEVQIRTPNLGVVTAPTYGMLKDATLRTFFELAEMMLPGFDPDKHFNKSDMVAKLPNGSEILFRSVEHPQRLRGPNLSWWWGDEAGFYRPEVRRIMIGRLRQFGAKGYEWLTTTPKGRNWLWQVYGKGRDGFGLVRAGTGENTHLDPEFYDELLEEYAGDYARQELEGEFIAWAGLIYSEFDHTRHVATIEDNARIVRTIAGVDWGFASPGVITVVGVDGDGASYVVAEQAHRQTRVEEWVGIAQGLRDAWGIERFYCDPSEPDNIKAFNEGGLKAEGANNAVNTGIQAVKNRLVVNPMTGKPRLFVVPSAVQTISEMEQYQWQEGRDGLQDVPVKANDHALDALRYAIMGLSVTKRAFKTQTEAGRYA